MKDDLALRYDEWENYPPETRSQNEPSLNIGQAKYQDDVIWAVVPAFVAAVEVDAVNTLLDGVVTLETPPDDLVVDSFT